MTQHSSSIFVPVLLGPTAVGKTAVAIAIAERFGWEIISCDSRQIYRYMDIGTAKPTVEERTRVPHRLVDIIDPDVRYSVHAFVKDATAAIRELAERGKVGFICGGTGLYFEALRRGIGPQVESDPGLREALMSRAARDGSAVLHAELAEKDPESAGRIHSNDVQRIVRALTVFYQTGAKLSSLKGLSTPPTDIAFKIAALAPPREIIYERINRRVDAMVKRGLWEEFLALKKRGFHVGSPGLQCVGYNEFFTVERGESSFENAVETIKRNSRRYAKRQTTWFRTHNAGDIIDYCNDSATLEKKVESIVAP